MSYSGSIKVTNRAGWSKTIDLEKSLCLIGSSGSNDVVLSAEYGSGVLPLHLQLLAPRRAPDTGSQSGSGAYRLVNLTDYEYPVFDHGLSVRGTLAPRSTCEIQDGNIIQLGDFTLAFMLNAKKGVSIERRTENIGVRLELPRTELEPGKTIAGLLTLINFGGQKRCQFSIELDGLPQACFQVAPAPLLYPGAAEELSIRFFHRGTQPQAGIIPVRITATAASSYPAEVIHISLDLKVAPVHQFSITVLDDPRQNGRSEIRTETPVSTAAAVTVERAAPDGETIPAPVSVPPAPEPGSGGKIPAAAEILPEPIPAAESVMASGQNAPVEQPISVPETVAELAQAEPQPEQSWWSEPDPGRSPAFQSERQGSLKKDIKSRLAGKDIQVIKAGLEIEEDDEAAG